MRQPLWHVGLIIVLVVACRLSYVTSDNQSAGGPSVPHQLDEDATSDVAAPADSLDGDNGFGQPPEPQPRAAPTGGGEPLPQAAVPPEEEEEQRSEPERGEVDVEKTREGLEEAAARAAAARMAAEVALERAAALADAAEAAAKAAEAAERAERALASAAEPAKMGKAQESEHDFTEVDAEERSGFEPKEDHAAAELEIRRLQAELDAFESLVAKRQEQLARRAARQHSSEEDSSSRSVGAAAAAAAAAADAAVKTARIQQEAAAAAEAQAKRSSVSAAGGSETDRRKKGSSTEIPSTCSAKAADHNNREDGVSNGDGRKGFASGARSRAGAAGLVGEEDAGALSEKERSDMEERIARIEELLHGEMDRLREMEDDEMSLMEIFGDRVKTFVVTKLTPGTDKECTFNWTRARCEPRCECKMDYKLGDYWPSRACRLVPLSQRDSACSPEQPHPTDEPVVSRFKRWAVGRKDRAVTLYRAHAPPTDEACRWSMRRWTCEPQPHCVFAFRPGDLTPHRSCRLRETLEAAAEQREFGAADDEDGDTED